MSVTFKGIDVVVLFVADLDRAKTFYRDTLGLSMSHEDQSSAYFDLEVSSLMLLDVAGARDLLSSDEVASEPSMGERSQLVAWVDDVDAKYADLRSRGVEFVREPVDRWWGLRTAHFKDPDGNIWEISQSIPQESAAGGQA